MARDRGGFSDSARPGAGSVTLVSLCLTTALGIALGSYLALCMHSARSSARLLNQTEVQELAQTGLEEALWALNNNNWTGSGPGGNTSWTTSGANRAATLTYTLPGSNLAGQVALSVADYASTGPTWPTITSAATVTLASGETISKSLRATTGPVPLFGNAIASASSYVSFAAGGTVDSWNSDPDNDSSTPAVAYSFTAGSPANYSAVVAGRTNGTYGVVLTQAAVRGYVATFGLPVSYSTSGSPPASVTGPTTPAGTNVDTARLGKSAFVPLAPVFTVTPPTVDSSGGGLLSSVLTLVATLLGAPTGTVFEWNGDLNVNGGLPLPLLNSSPSLTINTPTQFVVDGDLAIGSTGQITIAPGGSLELFVKGDVTIGGNGIDNQTHEPKKLVIFCTGNSTSDTITYTTSHDFCGAIYSENKPIDIRQNATFYGALLSGQYVRFGTSATAPVFHYDAALRQVRFNGVATPYLLTQVTEL